MTHQVNSSRFIEGVTHFSWVSKLSPMSTAVYNNSGLTQAQCEQRCLYYSKCKLWMVKVFYLLCLIAKSVGLFFTVCFYNTNYHVDWSDIVKICWFHFTISKEREKKKTLTNQRPWFDGWKKDAMLLKRPLSCACACLVGPPWNRHYTSQHNYNM